jgi:hypothetical protein
MEDPKGDNPVPDVALCGGCLRLHRICDLIPDENNPPGFCPVCGEEACCCPFCASSEALARLAAGDWSALQPHAAATALSWTPEGGIVHRALGTTPRARRP